MKIKGNLAYLSIDEQERGSGYENPIDLTTFDLHGERTQAEAAVARLEADIADGIVSGPAPQQALERARARSFVTRAIAKEWAIQAAVAEVDQEYRDLTR